MFTLRIGDPIPLQLQLASAQEDKFPVAILRDTDGNVVFGPISLTHQGNGLYADYSLAMPAEAILVATFIVYTDAGQTTFDTGENGHAIDVFIRTDAAQAVADFSEGIVLVVEEESVNFVVEDTPSVTFVAQEQSTLFTLEDTSQIAFTVADESVVFEVDCA